MNLNEINKKNLKKPIKTLNPVLNPNPKPTLNPDPKPTLAPDPNPDAKCNSNINKLKIIRKNNSEINFVS